MFDISVPDVILNRPQIVYVERVVDGDTFKGIIENKSVYIRLCGIDAPEKKQLFGSISTMYLRSLIDKQILVFEKISVDRYGRYIADVYLNNQSIQYNMLYNGMAFSFKVKGSKCKFPINGAEIML